MADTDITKEQVTEVELNGAGMFDHLMKAFKEHVIEEHDAGRIDHDQYATVYLGSTQTAMAQAIQFVLQEPINEAQADLLRAQKDKVEKEIETEEKNQDLIDAQIAKINKEIELMDKDLQIKDQQIINSQKQNELIDQQILGLQKDNVLKDEEILTAPVVREKLEAEISLIGKQENKIDQEILYTAQQVQKSAKEVELINEQVLTAPKQRAQIEAETGLINQRTNNAGQEFLVLQSQRTRTDNETELVKQKIFTEEAQIRDVVDGGTVAGVIGKKNDLYIAQREGFYRDAEQKAAKIYTDLWGITKSTNNETNPVPVLGEGSADVQKVLNKMREGIDAS